MFDISFAELMIIAVVGLLVIGPDKLPQVARTLGAFIGRLQRYVAQVKDEVNREARFEDLQNLQREIKNGALQVESSIIRSANEAQSVMSSVKADVKSKQPSVKSTTSKPSTKKSAIKKSPVQTKKSTVKKAIPARKVEKA